MPSADGRAAARVGADPGAAPEASLRVMALDDEADAVEFIERALRGKFQVEGFTDPFDALHALDREQYAVVICDQRMPGMTGVEFLLKACQRQPQGVRILLTAFAEMKTAVEAVNLAKVSAVLFKPVDVVELRREVERGISHHEALMSLRAKVRSMAERNREIGEALRKLERAGPAQKKRR